MRLQEIPVKDVTERTPVTQTGRQNTGAGHWFLEGWIGDHAVDFLVDSGSAVTAVSSSFYKNLREVGTPVGEIRAMNRRLCGANGSRIDILGCSFCVVSFLGLQTEFPILVRDLSTDAIIGTDILGSVLPHTLDIKHGVPVLVSNFGQDTMMVEPFSEIGMIAQVTAIQPVMEQSSRSPVDPSMLPEHLRDLLDRTSEGLGDLQRGRLTETLLEFVDLFPVPGSALTGHTEAVEHTIDTGVSLPIRCALRKMSPQKIKQEEACIEEMLTGGQIEPSDSPWSSPVVLVMKKDGGTRFCVDYRRLNLATVKDAYPLPRIDDTLDMLAGKRWFSTLDLASGYWQVSLSPDARCKTAFATHSGLFQFKVMPFGHLREVNGSSYARITMVPLSCVFGRHHLFRDDVRRRTGQPDIDF